MAFNDVMRAIVTLLKCLSDHVIHSWLPRWWVPKGATPILMTSALPMPDMDWPKDQ